MKSIKVRKICFLITILLLILFVVMGQIAVDRIAMESESGQFWGYESSFTGNLLKIGGAVVISCAAIAAFYLAIRFFPIKGIITKVLAWILGILLFAWTIFMSGLYFYDSYDYSGGVAGVAGLWLKYVEKMDVEHNALEHSKWFGKGDEMYAYSYDEYLDALSHLSLGNEEEEPYSSIANERDTIEHVFREYDSITLLNVLTHFYGKWVLVLYGVIVAAMLTISALLITTIDKLPVKILYASSWILLAIITVMPLLNGCALAFAFWGPPFTGGYLYWEFHVLITGPAIGAILGLSSQKNAKEYEHNAIESNEPSMVDCNIETINNIDTPMES